MRTAIFSLWLSAVYLCLLSCSDGLASDARKTATVRAVERARGAVANIHSEKTALDKDPAFRDGPPRKVNGMGTGIIVDERGYIVTNQHVIADVDALRVTLFDGSTYTARVISYDRKHDLAVIKIDPSRSLPVIPLGTSSDLMLGESVIAVGNAFGYEHTITAGIISSLSRDVEVNETQSYSNLLQTDASINPGNSGGPLLNLDGEVVGINVAIRAGAQRIGFAIPIDDARKFLARLLNTGRLNDTYHGLVTRDVKSPQNLKLVVDSAEPNSPASAAGFKPGDVVMHAGSVAVADQADLERAFLGHAPGEEVEVTVLRDQAAVTLKVQLARNADPNVNHASSQVVVRQPKENFDDQVWRVLGLRLAKISTAQLDTFRTRYRGGMKVVDVRGDSPAAQNGIQPGDILVGLHIWETTKAEDVSYVVNNPKLVSFDPLKFYVIRGPETLFGSLPLARERK